MRYLQLVLKNPNFPVIYPIKTIIIAISTFHFNYICLSTVSFISSLIWMMSFSREMFILPKSQKAMMTSSPLKSHHLPRPSSSISSSLLLRNDHVQYAHKLCGFNSNQASQPCLNPTLLSLIQLSLPFTHTPFQNQTNNEAI